MADSGDMWRQAQVGREGPEAWERNAANKCVGCGGKATSSDFVWTWGNGRRTSAALRGMYCLRCGPPEGEPKGADIAAAVRRSAGAAAGSA